jgi:hypothetical protein
MESTIIQPLLDRVRELEKANRRWKTLCAILTVIVLAVLIPGTTFIGYFALTHHRQAAAANEARAMEMVAREQAEVARQRAIEAFEQAAKQEKKE